MISENRDVVTIIFHGGRWEEEGEDGRKGNDILLFAHGSNLREREKGEEERGKDQRVRGATN